MSDLKSQLRVLVSLQASEIAIDHIEKELAGIDDRVDALNDELSEYQIRVTDQEQLLVDLKKKYRADEDEVQLLEARIVKSKEKLGAVKTNKEYQSMLKEIDDLKVKSSQLEDRILENLDRIEASEKILVELKADLADITSEVHQKQEAIRKNAENQRNELGSRERKRNEIWDAMESANQTVYQKVKRQGNGIAVAQIADSVCQVCRMNIPPQLFHELLRMDRMRMCPNCQRIMYPKALLEED